MAPLTREEIIAMLCNRACDDESGELCAGNVVGYCPADRADGEEARPKVLVRRQLKEGFLRGLPVAAPRLQVELVEVGAFGSPGFHSSNVSVFMAENGIYVQQRGHFGTAGALLEGKKLLSCAHVLSPQDARVEEAKNYENRSVGMVSDHSALRFGCPNLNLHDSALVPDLNRRVILAPYSLTPGDPLRAPASFYGAASEDASCAIICTDAWVKCDFEYGEVLFEKQVLLHLETPDDCVGGNSGSLVLQDDQTPVALLHSMSFQGCLSAASPIKKILGHYQLKLIAHDTR